MIKISDLKHSNKFKVTCCRGGHEFDIGSIVWLYPDHIINPADSFLCTNGQASWWMGCSELVLVGAYDTNKINVL